MMTFRRLIVALPRKAAKSTLCRRRDTAGLPCLLAIAIQLVSGCSIVPGLSRSEPEMRQTVPAATPLPVSVSMEELPADSLLGEYDHVTYPRIESSWVDSLMGTLTLNEKVAQMVVPFTYSEFDARKFGDLLALVRDRGVGGVIISRGTAAVARKLIDSLQSVARIPLLVSADFENGAGMRLSGATEFPSMMALGATRNPDLAYAMGRIVAAESRAIGVHQNYAPVLDVNNNPLNPIINIRSFGEDPSLVASLGMAYARGLQDGRVIATAKHFPGHGDTETDSHTSLPTLPFPRARLDSVELLPFRRAVESGILSVMTGHLAVPAAEPVPERPATLSVAILDSLLHDSMGFRGLVVSDALNMKALTNSYQNGVANALAVRAGVNVLLMPTDAGETIDSLAAAVNRGEIPLEAIDRSVRKILSYKQWLGLAGRSRRNTALLAETVGTDIQRSFALQIARRSVTLVRNDSLLLPLPGDRSARVSLVVFRQGNGSDGAGQFEEFLKDRLGNVHTVTVDRKCSPSARDAIFDSVSPSRLVLVAAFLNVRTGSGEISLSRDQKALADRLGVLRIPSVLLSFGSPYVLAEIPWVNGYMCAYGDDSPSIRASAEILFGDIAPSGRLPVTIPGYAERGTALSYQRRKVPGGELPVPEIIGPHFSRVDSLIGEQIYRRAFPGAQLAVIRDGRLVHARSYGAQTYDPLAVPVTDETMYDLASLTKVVVTTTAAMKLYEEGQLSLDDRVVKYLPGFGAKGKDHITLRNLLLHNSGLTAFRLFYTLVKSPRELLDSIFASPLEYATGTRTVYSDLGVIVLGKVIERLTGKPLDAYARENIFTPLGMAHTMFTPPDSLLPRIAPTEADSYWRRRLVRGTVHDETAALLGGVAGHAGLFSTAGDLAVFARMLLNGGELDGVRVLRKSTIELFTKRQSRSSSRALGWDTRSSAASSAGKYFSARSFGHTGFTGTSIWIDPDAGTAVIFLTNRVHPTRENRQLIAFRAVLHDAIREAMASDGW